MMKNPSVRPWKLRALITFPSFLPSPPPPSPFLLQLQITLWMVNRAFSQFEEAMEEGMWHGYSRQKLAVARLPVAETSPFPSFRPLRMNGDCAKRTNEVGDLVLVVAGEFIPAMVKS